MMHVCMGCCVVHRKLLPEAPEVILLHGTAKDYADAISKRNFDASKVHIVCGCNGVFLNTVWPCLPWFTRPAHLICVATPTLAH